MNRLPGFSAAAMLAFVAAGNASAGTTVFRVCMDGKQEAPPTSSAGLGDAILKVDDVSLMVSVSGTFSGLGAAATAAHIHGPAAVGANGPIILSMTVTNAQSGTFSASAMLSATQIADILAGLTYINIHTSMFPPGEIRGQISDPPIPDRIFCFPGDPTCAGVAAQCAFNTARISISSCSIGEGFLIVSFDQDPAGFIDTGFAGYLNVSKGGMGPTTNPISDGVLCLIGAGAVGRYTGPDLQLIDAVGHMELDILNSQKTGGCDVPLITSQTGSNYCNSPGTTWTFQWWFRRSMMNPASTLSGFSEAMAVIIR